jgi:type IV pilus assembly protein PilP
MRAAIIIIAGLCLAACDGTEHKDLKNELEILTKNVKGNIEPLPTVKPYQPVAYQALELPDPFKPSKIVLANEKQGSKGTGQAPDDKRPKEPLEAFPLESLKMVGTLARSKNVFALVKADQGLYRVRVGNYLGQNYGVITKITESEITLRELVQDGGDEWNERTSSLLLQEAEVKK